MGKVEIKIRKKILTPDNLQQYRNYPALLKKYERNKRFKRALRIFMYSLGLTMLVLALIFLGMWKVLEDKKKESSKPKTFSYLQVFGNRIDTIKYHSYSDVKTDSFYIVSYQYDTLFHQQYHLPVKPEFNDTTFIFNDSIVDREITYERTKTFNVQGQNYTIIKYLIALPGMDGDAFIFYSPEFGLLHIRSRTWQNYSRLIHTGDLKNDIIIKQLTQLIENDEAFFKGWRP